MVKHEKEIRENWTKEEGKSTFDGDGMTKIEEDPEELKKISKRN